MVQNTCARNGKDSGDDDVAEAVGGPRVSQKFIHAEVGVVFRSRNFVSSMYTEVDNGKSQGYKLRTSRAKALNVFDKASDGLSASAYHDYQEDKKKSHPAKTGLGNMDVVEARRYRRAWR